MKTLTYENKLLWAINNLVGMNSIDFYAAFKLLKLYRSFDQCLSTNQSWKLELHSKRWLHWLVHLPQISFSFQCIFLFYFFIIYINLKGYGISWKTCQVKRAWHKKPHIVLFCLYEIPRIGKSIKTEIRLTVARAWGGEVILGSDWLMDADFLLVMKMS